ncbi:MAG: exodeoxyribonuclease VII small subunit [Methanophagales archaeon]|nr:exodeoxyribonuclease VII small subunit [Methanophagales archaeon]
MEAGEAITFEEAMKKLESIVETLGEGNLSLEDSLKMFEEGMELCKFCNKKLDEAEYKVEKLMEKEGGEISREEFKVEE